MPVLYLIVKIAPSRDTIMFQHRHDCPSVDDERRTGHRRRGFQSDFRKRPTAALLEGLLRFSMGEWQRPSAVNPSLVIRVPRKFLIAQVLEIPEIALSEIRNQDRLTIRPQKPCCLHAALHGADVYILYPREHRASFCRGTPKLLKLPDSFPAQRLIGPAADITAQHVPIGLSMAEQQKLTHA